MNKLTFMMFHAHLNFALLHVTSDDQLFFLLHSHVFSNSSSLFMSMPISILINMNIMDMKKHMLIFVFISMLVGREWD